MSTDVENLPELTKRQEDILMSIIRAYSQKPEAVSSKYIVENFNPGVSSATVRNEMAVLEELGYISAPHTSAGRVPTENGYRYVVRRVMDTSDLSQSERTHIAEQFNVSPLATERWMRLAATVLARTAQTASLVTPPTADISIFKHVELVSIQGRLVLMILVLEGGVVQQRMLNLVEPVPQNKLTEAAIRINAACIGLSSQQMELKSIQMPLLEREVMELAVEVMNRADNNQARIIYREGLSDTISNFTDGEGAQQAIRVYEERAFMEMILNELLDTFIDDVKVIVAGNGHEELNQLSMVLSRYGIPGQLSGAIGVVGPTHLNYGRAISSVRYISSLMTNMLVKLYDDGKNSDEPISTDK